MRINYTLVLVIMAVGLFFTTTSCEAPRLPFEEAAPKLVVISEFTSNQILQVEVSESRALSNDAGRQNYVLDASVDLYEGERFLETLVLKNDQIRPFYTTRFFTPSAKVRYSILVNAPGFDPVRAQSSIPNQIAIHRIDVSDFRQTPGKEGKGNNYSYQVTVNFEDPSEEINYYHLNFLQQVITKVPVGEGYKRKTEMIKAEFGDLNQQDYLPAKVGGVLFSDEKFNGLNFSGSFPMYFELEPSQELGKLIVELRSASDDYYFFQTSVTRQQGPGVPVQGEVAVYNNIENGQGIFAGYNLSIDSVAVLQ